MSLCQKITRLWTANDRFFVQMSFSCMIRGFRHDLKNGEVHASSLTLTMKKIGRFWTITFEPSICHWGYVPFKNQSHTTLMRSLSAYCKRRSSVEHSIEFCILQLLDSLWQCNDGETSITSVIDYQVAPDVGSIAVLKIRQGRENTIWRDIHCHHALVFLAIRRLNRRPPVPLTTRVWHP